MTTDRELWVIDPSLRNREDQGVRQVLDGWDGASRVFRPALDPGDGPAPGAGYAVAGVVLLGSAASVHDRSPWLSGLGAWIRPIVTGEIVVPLLGVCFGHQLVADVAGGEVGNLREDGSKLVAVSDTRMRGSRLLPGERDLRVVISHRETVRRPAAGFRSTAARDEVPFDGLEHEDLPVYSVQFHPEARDEFAGRAGLETSSIDSRVRADGAALLSAFRDEVSARGFGSSSPSSRGSG